MHADSAAPTDVSPPNKGPDGGLDPASGSGCSGATGGSNAKRSAGTRAATTPVDCEQGDKTAENAAALLQVPSADGKKKASKSAALANDGESAEKSADKTAENAVSALQELIQSCSSFSPHTKILTWTFDQQLEKGNSLEFRATVSFVLGDVPHHFCGGWQTSKKKAQRDTADRVTHYLQRARQNIEGGVPAHAALDIRMIPSDVLEELQAIYDSGGVEVRPPVPEGTDGCDFDSTLEWQLEERPSKSSGAVECRATVTFYIHDVPHHFCGGWCENRAAESAGADGGNAARKDAVERVLWYFGKSEEGFQAVERTALTSAGPPPQLSTAAAASSTSVEKQPGLEDKTILMQVQNTLQKAFAKDTPPGQRVWVWSYEADEQDPQLFRARVDIPAWRRVFFGDWCRGKKLAQRNACLVVKEQVDKELV